MEPLFSEHEFPPKHGSLCKKRVKVDRIDEVGKIPQGTLLLFQQKLEVVLGILVDIIRPVNGRPQDCKRNEDQRKTNMRSNITVAFRLASRSSLESVCIIVSIRNDE